MYFSKWGRIFKDPMTTHAAIDRLVHRSVILELVGKSVRGDEAVEARKLLDDAESVLTEEAGLSDDDGAEDEPPQT